MGHVWVYDSIGGYKDWYISLLEQLNLAWDMLFVQYKEKFKEKLTYLHDVEVRLFVLRSHVTSSLNTRIHIY